MCFDYYICVCKLNNQPHDHDSLLSKGSSVRVYSLKQTKLASKNSQLLKWRELSKWVNNIQENAVILLGGSPLFSFLKLKLNLVLANLSL